MRQITYVQTKNVVTCINHMYERYIPFSFYGTAHIADFNANHIIMLWANCKSITSEHNEFFYPIFKKREDRLRWFVRMDHVFEWFTNYKECNFFEEHVITYIIKSLKKV